MRSTLTLLTLLLLSLAAAQNSPFYLLSTLPEINVGESVRGALTEDDGQNFFDGSYVDLIKFYGVADEVVEVSVTSYDFIPYLALYSSDGTLLANGGNDYWGNQATLSFGLPVSGRYHIVVNGSDQYEMGDYTVSLDALEAVDGGELQAGASVLGVLQANDEADRGAFYDIYTVTFDKPMSEVLITMSSGLIGPYLYLYNEGGRSVLAEDGDSWGSAQLDLVDLPAGTYEIVATSYYTDEMGTYELALDARGPDTFTSN